MFPGPMEHLKANAIAMVVGAALVLVVQALGRQEAGEDGVGRQSFWERWTGE